MGNCNRTSQHLLPSSSSPPSTSPPSPPTTTNTPLHPPPTTNRPPKPSKPRDKHHKLPLPRLPSPPSFAYTSPTDRQRWSSLYHTHTPFLTDPADVHTVLNECIVRTTDLLQSAEMTTLTRRVRKTVRSLLHTPAATPSESYAKPHHRRNSSRDSNLSVPSPHPPPASLSDIRSRAVFLKERLLDEGMIRKIFMAGNRRLRVGAAEGWVERGMGEWRRRKGEGEVPFDEEGLKGATTTTTTTGVAASSSSQPSTPSRMNGSGSTNAKSSVGDPIGSAYVLLTFLSSERWDYVSEVAKLSAQCANLTLDVNEAGLLPSPTTGGEEEEEEAKKSPFDEQTPPPSPIPRRLSHSTFTEYYYSDHHQQQQQQQQQNHTSSSSCSTATTSCTGSSTNNSHSKNTTSPTTTSPHPPPPKIPGAPAGISLREIAFLMALALRSPRQRRLTLLFYLLLPPTDLIRLLKNHMAGGVPTWLLESVVEHGGGGGEREGVVLSYASLCHYYYYGGNVPVERRGGGDGVVSPPPPPPVAQAVLAPRELSVDVVTAIETIGVLLYAPDPFLEEEGVGEEAEEGDGSTTGGGGSPSRGNTTPQHHPQQSSHLNTTGKMSLRNRARTLSYGDRRYRSARAHLMLTKYVHGIRGGTSDSSGPAASGAAAQAFLEMEEEEVGQRLDMLDRFWGGDMYGYGGSGVYYEKAVKNRRVRKRGSRSAVVGTPTSEDGSNGSADRSKSKRKKGQRKGGGGGGGYGGEMGDDYSIGGSAQSVEEMRRERDRGCRWTLVDFLSWADRALPEENGALDVVMNHIFGMGILPTPAMERDLVAKTWVNWEMDLGGEDCLGVYDEVSERRRRVVEDDEWKDRGEEGGKGGDGSSVSLSQGLKNLFNFSGSMSGDGHIRDGPAAPAALSTGSDEAQMSVNQACLSSSHSKVVVRRKIWGGIGLHDDKGGAGYGLLHCIPRSWWDSWVAYVGWTWSDSASAIPMTSSSSKQRRRRHSPHNHDYNYYPPPQQNHSRSRCRPSNLSTEPLLDRSGAILSGTGGSYELMRKDLRRDIDYVLIPPAVWDVLYEMYGGGPPLPRMVMSKDDWAIDSSEEEGEGENIETVMETTGVGTVVRTCTDGSGMEDWVDRMPRRLPPNLTVETHPWVLSCHVCDPHQPYRRGNVGAISIRIMATPDQPLWRLFAEIVLRLPINHPRGKDANGIGRGRLWRKIVEDGGGEKTLEGGRGNSGSGGGGDANGSEGDGDGKGKATEEKDEKKLGGNQLRKGNMTNSVVTRYGPWQLLCKSRSATFAVSSTPSSSTTTKDRDKDKDNNNGEIESANKNHSTNLNKNKKNTNSRGAVDHETFRPIWKEYGDGGTVASVGLADGDSLLFEYGLFKKNANFTWPREAAACAGEKKREEEEDHIFRLRLRGIDPSSMPLPSSTPSPPSSTSQTTKPPPQPTLVPNVRSTLIGFVIDCMDSNGRWFQAEISEIETVPPPTKSNLNGGRRRNRSDYGSGSLGSPSTTSTTPTVHATNRSDDTTVTKEGRLVGEVTAIRVDFCEVGGREEWIATDSDRLAPSERVTRDSLRSMDNADGTSSPPGTATKGGGANSSGGSNGMGRMNQQQILKRNSSIQNNKNNFNPSICLYPGFGACGLSNLGNSCYVNSAVQCISYMPLVRSYLVASTWRRNGDLNRDNPLGSGGKILEEFAELMKIMWSGRVGKKTPGKFRLQLGRARSQYSAHDQQDAQELLNDVLDTLHEDGNRIKNKPYVEALEDSWVRKTDLPRVGQEAWRRFLRRNSSFITDLSMGQVLNSVTCPKCNHTSRSFDPFNMLSLPFPTIAEMTFRCRVYRRVSSVNCPRTLGPRRSRSGSSSTSRSRSMSVGGDELACLTKSSSIEGGGGSASGSNNRFEFEVSFSQSVDEVVEEFIIPMGRLSDISDLRREIQNLSGIPSNRFKIYAVEHEDGRDDEDCNVDVDGATGGDLFCLNYKEGPCLNLAKGRRRNKKKGGSEEEEEEEDDVEDEGERRLEEDGTISLTRIFCYESTLLPRPPPPDNNDNKEEEEEEENGRRRKRFKDSKKEEQREPQEQENHSPRRRARSMSLSHNNSNEDADLATDHHVTRSMSLSSTRQGGAGGGVPTIPLPKLRPEYKHLLTCYGDSSECRLYDTDPIPLAKALSRRLFPDISTTCNGSSVASRLHLGLRVDALDHNNHWYPGTIIDISHISRRSSPNGSSSVDPVKKMVKVHFDNFSHKWDLNFCMEHFVRGEVRPIYTSCRPKEPMQIQVYHRIRRRRRSTTPSPTNATTNGTTNQNTTTNTTTTTNRWWRNGATTFGTTFFLQAHTEWTTARAAAHIFARAALFLENSLNTFSPRRTSEMSREDLSHRRRSNMHRALIGEVIDVLIDADRRNYANAFSVGFDSERYNPESATAVLERRLHGLLNRLPFSIRVCNYSSKSSARDLKRASSSASSGSGGGEDVVDVGDVPFEFSLWKTMGNYMTAKKSLVLAWKDGDGLEDGQQQSKQQSIPDNISTATSSSTMTTTTTTTTTTTALPIYYIPPIVSIHRQSHEALHEQKRQFHERLHSTPSNNTSNNNNDSPNALRLDACLDEFCKVQRLGTSESWRCPKCRRVREGRQSMTVWRLPDLLTFHLKRFNCTARWREKIVTKVNFPLTGLDMRDWCDDASPAFLQGSDDGYIYDLIGVVNHLGGMTGGHYVANCKASVCSPIGSEEVEHNFNGAGVQAFGDSSSSSLVGADGEERSGGGWKPLGMIRGVGGKDKDGGGDGRGGSAGSAAATSAGDSCEPLWLHFDDDLVEPIPPSEVVVDTAYVLFYRRRRFSPGNIARYSTMI